MTKNKIKYPLSDDELTKIFDEKRICPDCESPAEKTFLDGPTGGMCVNIKCSNCGSFFNNMGPFGLSRINNLNHQYYYFMWTSNMDCQPTNKFTPFTPKIIQTWYKVSVTAVDSLSRWHELYDWCSNNCSKRWSIKSGICDSGDSVGNAEKDGTLFFEDKHDAVLFQLSN